MFDKLKEMDRLLLLFTFIISFSCAQRIKVPINRMMTPETIGGGGADLEFQRLGFSQARLDFFGGATDNPLKLTGVINNRSLYMAAGVSDQVDIFLRVPQESSSLLGVKFQVLGVPSNTRNNTHQLAFTIGFGAERDAFEGPFEIDLKSDVKDYSIIYGFRLNQYFIPYISLSLSDYHFRGVVKDGGGVLLGDSINYRARNILGGQLGGEFGIHGFSLKFEVAAQKIKWTNTEEKLLYSSGLAIRATF